MDKGFDDFERKSVTSSRPEGFKKISEFILLALVFFLPFFFIPFSIFPFQFGKVIIFSLAILAIFSLWLFEALSKKRITLPVGLTLYSSGIILGLVLLSSLFSETIWRSMIGIGSETETFFSLLMLFLSLFLTYSLIKNGKSVLSLYGFLNISAVIIFIYQTLRLIIGPEFLSFGIFTSTASSILGKWNDLGVFFGLILIISSLRLMILGREEKSKWLYYSLSLVSLLAIAIINSLLIWIVTGVFALMMLIYEISFSGGEEQNEKTSSLTLPAIIVIISIIFIFARSFVGGFVAENLNINQIEVRPSWSSTIDIARESISNDPILGAGPNQFSSVWNQTKPIEVNNTPFWNIDFNFGIGFIPTTIVTQGVLGFIAWLVFLASLILLGLKALLAAGSVRGMDKFIILSSLSATLYLWTFMVTYLPGTVMVAMSFIMAGIFLGVMSYMNLIREKQIIFGRDSITSFGSALAISLMLLVNIALFYSIGVRYLSATYFQKSLISINTNNDIESGESEARRALSLTANDRNYRLLSNIEILKLNNLVSSIDDLSEDSNRNAFQSLLGSAIQNAQLATRQDETNYQNWISLGSIYESIIPIGIEGAYESAISTYGRAQIENPTSPRIDLILARTEVANNNTEKAREHINNALEKKNNYTEAVFLLSQIEIAEGNINEAIRSSESATLISPNDPILFFQLGFLRYNQDNFRGAVEPLERAVALNPPYSNAKYFLGLSYSRLNRTEEAIKQFEDLIVLNPENNEIKVILQNIKDGSDPFFGLETEEPEERDSLPVEDEN